MENINIPNRLIILVSLDKNLAKNQRDIADYFMAKSSNFRIITSNEIIEAEVRDRTEIKQIIERQQRRAIPSVFFVSDKMNLDNKSYKTLENVFKNVYHIEISQGTEFYTLKNSKCNEETNGRSLKGLVNFACEEILEFYEQQNQIDNEIQ